MPMTKSSSKQTPPASGRLKAATRQEITDSSAKAIMDAETARRDAKTARLRQLRLDQAAVAASNPPPPAAAKPRRKGKAAAE